MKESRKNCSHVRLNMSNVAQRINDALDSLKVSDDLRNFEYISLGMMLKLAENGVLSLDDLADLDNEELVEMLSEHGLEDDTEAGDIIMAARAHWFEDEAGGDDASGEADGSAAMTPQRPTRAMVRDGVWQSVAVLLPGRHCPARN